MNYLKISNQGLIDVEALTLLGASSKRNESNKIGMFGSGNKYAIAYLLRNHYELEIYSGKESIKVDTTKKTFREQSFDVIRFNEKESSITTEFGKDWKLWQAIRELYCNAIDEGKHTIEFVKNITPVENETHFYIKNRAEITNFITSFDSYFTENKKVLFECKDGKILSKGNEATVSIYRKGVRCFETSNDSVYDYDLSNISIDENRLVRYSWEVPSYIWNLIYQCTNKEVIKNILFNCSEYKFIENLSSDFSSVSVDNMSEEFKEVLKELTLAPRGMSGLLSIEELGNTTIIPTVIFEQAKTIISNDNLAQKFKVYKDSLYIEIEQDSLHRATLKKAEDFFTECNYIKPLQYNIKIARFDRKDILGFAEESTNSIVLSEVCLDKGVQVVIETMIEEYIHLSYQVADKTRAFQDAAITEIVNLLKIKNAYLV
jgi:hypothetical protein